MVWNREDLIEWLILPFNQSEGRHDAWRRSHPNQHPSEVAFCSDVKAANETPLGQFIADCSNFWSRFQSVRIKHAILVRFWRLDWNRRTGAIRKRKPPVFVYVPSEGRCLQPRQIIELASERGCSVSELMEGTPKLERKEAIA